MTHFISVIHFKSCVDDCIERPFIKVIGRPRPENRGLIFLSYFPYPTFQEFSDHS